ncbi:MAG: ABC transporter ATP-binding protein [Lachnospiraceae bacterium]|nr:ABC transporter ATP-binding protein [Lachnospiraceae bacterium]
MDTDIQNVIEMKDMYKIYPNGTVANSGVNFCVKKGEIHALVGENGAGKTTLMKVLFGLEEKTKGAVYISGKEVNFKSPKEAIANGMGMVHQEFMLVPSYTVAQNIALGNEKTKKIFCDRKSEKEQMEKISKQFGLAADFDEPVYRLSVGAKQRIEILKVLYNNAKIIILDEPTAVLTPQETEELFCSLRLMVKDGYTIVLITHKIKEVMDISDSVTVLRNGQTIKTLKTGETNPDEITRLMIGRQLKPKRERVECKDGKTIFEVSHLNVMDRRGALKVRDMSFAIKAGEIFGIAGVEGNGQSELIDAIIGFLKPSSGRIFYNGKDITGISTSDFRKESIGYIPDDRNLRGSSLTQSVAENFIICSHNSGKFNKGPYLNWKEVRKDARDLIAEYEIKADSETALVGSMSGGNVQKVIVAREISKKPNLLIACQPTRGVDISSIEYIHNKIIEQRNEGTAVLLISAELTEIMGLSDKIGMLYNGELVAVRDNDDSVTENEIGKYILNGRQNPSGTEE